MLIINSPINFLLTLALFFLVDSWLYSITEIFFKCLKETTTTSSSSSSSCSFFLYRGTLPSLFYNMSVSCVCVHIDTGTLCIPSIPNSASEPKKFECYHLSDIVMGKHVDYLVFFWQNLNTIWNVPNPGYIICYKFLWVFLLFPLHSFC